MRGIFGAFALVASLALPCPVRITAAQEVVLSPSADTTLSENHPTNNLGAVPFFIAGTTQNHTRNRALLRFDLSAWHGTPVRVASAELWLEVVGEPNERPEFSDFSLHRVLTPWGEGAKRSPVNCVSCQGQGSAATIGEAAWDFAAAFTNLWSAPGGGDGADFVSSPSASTTVYGIAGSPYLLGSSQAMVEDVQSWLASSENNHGWMLLCRAEGTPLTARRFASREDPANAPRLVLRLVHRPTVSVLRIQDNQVTISFPGVAGHSYEIQRSSPLESSWMSIKAIEPLEADVAISIVEPINHAAFYRVLAR